MNRKWWLIWVLMVSVTGRSQYVLYDVPVINPFTDASMQFPFCGGFNNPQFSDVDMNLDGLTDLLIFDRSGNVAMVLYRQSFPGEPPQFSYQTSLDPFLPVMRDWALTYDYNCDDLPDLLTYISGSAALYRGVITDGHLDFQLEVPELLYTSSGGFILPVYTSRTDLPGLADVDGDGDMDILAFSLSGVQIRWYRNNSVESGYGCDSLIYSIADYCWGEIFEGATCDGADLGVECLGEGSEEQSRMHVGSTILVFDKDLDGVQDMVLGDVSCDNLVYYQNGGTPGFASMVSKDTLYPVPSYPAKLPVFPGAYLVDMNADGGKDLLVAPNDDLYSVNNRHILWYSQITPGGPQELAFTDRDFFTGNAIDMGDYSHPAWMDVDGDGLMDMVCGVRENKALEELPSTGLWYWRNTGTAEDPSFALVDDDLFGLQELGILSLSPSAGDADGDGDIDLMLGAADGTLIYMENTAGPGAAVAMNEPVLFYEGIDVISYSKPCLFDVDLDGAMDLIIGNVNGVLHYYHKEESSYVLVSSGWGGVDVRRPGDLVGHSAPFMFRNESGLMQLVVGSASGHIFLYDEIEESMLGEFHERDTLFLGILPGMFSTISGTDLNNDGEPEFAVGNIRGGLHLMQRDPDVAIGQQTEPEREILIYPNPASEQLLVQGLRPGNWTYHLLDMNGRLQMSGTLAPDYRIRGIHVLMPGCYILELSEEGGKLLRQCIVLQP